MNPDGGGVVVVLNFPNRKGAKDVSQPKYSPKLYLENLIVFMSKGYTPTSAKMLRKRRSEVVAVKIPVCGKIPQAQG